MKRREWLAAAGLIAFAALAFWFMWSTDPAHRSPAPMQASYSAPLTPTLKEDDYLYILPVAEMFTGEDPIFDASAIVCRVAAGVEVKIIGSVRLNSGPVYLRLRATPDCQGWIPASHVANYPDWRNTTERGRVIEH